MGSCGVRVSTSKRPEISQSAERASPRKPKEATDLRSPKPVILLVWCFRVSAWWCVCVVWWLVVSEVCVCVGGGGVLGVVCVYVSRRGG